MTQKVNHITKAGRRFVLASAILFSCLSFLYAQEQVMRIYYRFDSAVVDTTYLSNAQAFEVVDKMLSSGPGSSFEIVSYSSPEGSSIYNQMLSERTFFPATLNFLENLPSGLLQRLGIYFAKKFPKILI